jgi:hypothetical protein
MIAREGGTLPPSEIKWPKFVVAARRFAMSGDMAILDTIKHKMS